MNRPLAAVAAMACLGVAAACANLGVDRLLSVSATSTIQGLIYFDYNGNRQPDAGDDSVRNVRVTLVDRGSGDSVASVLSDIRGVYSIPAAPVGTYRIVVDTTLLADTAVVDRMDSTEVTLTPGDTTRVNVTVSYPRASIAAARLLPVGRKVFLEGLALNPLNAFRDTTLHIQDTSAAIRATRVFPVAVAAGDSVRLRGTISRRPSVGNPQPTIDLVTVFSLGPRFLPPAPQLTSSEAATARSGQLDAWLVQVLDATISDTARVGGAGGDFVLTVNSPSSGALEVLLDVSGAFQAGIPPTYVPGNRFDIYGVLVPTGVAGTWRLKPRSAPDLLPS